MTPEGKHVSMKPLTKNSEPAIFGPTLAHRAAIDPTLWTRLVTRIVRDEEDMTKELAERIMDQALGYLKLAAAQPRKGFAPSPLVDIGWHTFILYTHPYAEFCSRVTGGGFIHHHPSDDSEREMDGLTPEQTAQAMRAMGLAVDDPLWTCFDKDSSCNCNQGQGCRCGPCNY